MDGTKNLLSYGIALPLINSWLIRG